MVYFKFEFSLGMSKRQVEHPKAPKYNEPIGWDEVSRQVEKARDEVRFKTASNYLTAARSWTRFIGRDDWRFSEMNGELVERYQRWLGNRGISPNTSSAYMRSLRVMHNRWQEAVISSDRDESPVKTSLHHQQPFARVFTGRAKTAKRSISEETLLRLHSLSLPESGSLSLARDLFMFSFYAMGMPFVDIAYLRKDQVKGDKIHYARHKTGQPITVTVLPPMLQMMKRYESSGSDYVFPILSDAAPDVQHREYCRSLRRYNYSLHRLSEMLGLPRSLSSYVVRHSWASIAYRHHVDLGMIGKAMGHTKTSTTLLYIRSLFDPDLATANQELMEGLGL